MNKPVIISLGGSLINPGAVDIEFLINFRKLILDQIKKGRRFVIITGGGKLCRQYQEALKKADKPTASDLDWLGIHTTWFNAELVRLIFGKLAHKSIAKDPTKKIIFREKVLVGGGWKPGRSSDAATVRYAQMLDSNTIINVSNIDHVYTKDPNKFQDAKPIKEISWPDFKKIIGAKWDPGKNLPFDPVAAKDAQKGRIKVIITDGKNLNNLTNILEGKPFIGTVVK